MVDPKGILEAPKRTVYPSRMSGYVGLRETPPLARLMCRPWAKLDSETRTVYPVYAVTAQRSYLHFQMTIASLRLNDSPSRASGICFRYLRCMLGAAHT